MEEEKKSCYIGGVVSIIIGFKTGTFSRYNERYGWLQDKLSGYLEDMRLAHNICRTSPSLTIPRTGKKEIGTSISLITQERESDGPPGSGQRHATDAWHIQETSGTLELHSCIRWQCCLLLNTG